MPTQETPTRPQPGTSPVEGLTPSPVLGAKLLSLRRRFLSVESLKGLSLVVIVCLELLALLMFLDWWFDFPWALRLVLFLIQLAVCNLILFKHVFRHQFSPPDDEELALRVERAHPELRSRLISSVQFARPGSLPPGASRGLALSTLEQTEAATAGMDFRNIVPLEGMRRMVAVASAVLVLALAGFYVSRSVSVDLLRRAFLASTPVPRKTRIDWITGDLTVGRGDTLVIEAGANGVVPRKGTLRLTAEGRTEQVFPLERHKEIQARFARVLENVQEGFSYRVDLNDASSPSYTVRVVPRPTVAQLECEYVPPAYSGIKPGKRAPGDLTLLAGSRLRFQALATQPLKSAQVRLLGLETHQPVTIDPADPRRLAGDIAIPAKGLSGFSFDLVDAIDMKSPQGTVYRIDILPDKPPQPRITWPERKEELVTRTATLVVGFQVVDDFAIRQVSLKYRISTLDNGAESATELALDPVPPVAGSAQPPALNRIQRRYEWRLSSFNPPLPEGSLIEYWIEAVDNNDVTGPGVGTSEHQLARVVSENEKRTDLLNRAGDSIGVLGDVTADQEKLNRNLGTLILERTGAR